MMKKSMMLLVVALAAAMPLMAETEMSCGLVWFDGKI